MKNHLKKIALIAALGFAMSGCEGIDQPELPPGSSGDECVANAECQGIEVCLEGRCGLPDSQDPDGEACEEEGPGVCDDAEHCVDARQCIEPERVCGDLTCLEGRICLNGACVDDPDNPGVGGEGGQGGIGGNAGEGGAGGNGGVGGFDDTCAEHEDCPEGQICEGMVCTDEGLDPNGPCTTRDDCAPNERCLNGACFPDDQVGQIPCVDDDECAQGSRCDAEGQCVPEQVCTSNESCDSPLLECDMVRGICVDICPDRFDVPRCPAVLPNPCAAGEIFVCEPNGPNGCWDPRSDTMLDERAEVRVCPDSVCNPPITAAPGTPEHERQTEIWRIMRRVCSQSSPEAPMCVRNQSGRPGASSDCVLIGRVEVRQGAQHPDGFWLGGITGVVCPEDYEPGSGRYVVYEGVEPIVSIDPALAAQGRVALTTQGVDLDTYRSQIATDFNPIRWLSPQARQFVDRLLEQNRIDIPFLDVRDAIDDRALTRDIINAILWQLVNDHIQRIRFAVGALVWSPEKCEEGGFGWPCVNLDHLQGGFMRSIGLVNGVPFGKIERGNDGEIAWQGGGLDVEVRSARGATSWPNRPYPPSCFEGGVMPTAVSITDRYITDGRERVWVCNGDLPAQDAIGMPAQPGPDFVGQQWCTGATAPAGTQPHGANVLTIGTSKFTTHNPPGTNAVGRVRRVRSGPFRVIDGF